MLITCVMRGHTNFNGVTLLFNPLLRTYMKLETMSPFMTFSDDTCKLFFEQANLKNKIEEVVLVGINK